MKTVVDETQIDLAADFGRLWARSATFGELSRANQHFREFDQLLNDPQSDQLTPPEVFAVVKTLVGGGDSDVCRFIEKWLSDGETSALNTQIDKSFCYRFFVSALSEAAAMRRQWN